MADVEAEDAAEDAEDIDSKTSCEEVATMATFALVTKVLVPNTGLDVGVATGKEVEEEEVAVKNVEVVG